MVKKNLVDLSKNLIVVILIVFLIRTYVMVPYTVNGDSMMPTLKNSERVFVSKLADPQRFDIIVFQFKDIEYVKRVIGLPGDKIEYKNDVLYINGIAYEEHYLNKNKTEVKDRLGEDVLLTEDFTLKSLIGNETVPKDTLFVLGDNRRNSIDSREIGVISNSYLKGISTAVYWPMKEIRNIK